MTILTNELYSLNGPKRLLFNYIHAKKVANMLTKLTLGIFTALFSLSLSALEVDSYIVNGTDTSTSTYPSYARLYYNEYGNYGYCGGTFIDATHVLTAAHCVDQNADNISEVDLLFTVAIPNLDDEDDASNATKYYVSKFYIHEDYDRDQVFLNDIAILELESAVNISSYTQFASDQNLYRADGVNETFVAVGHGNTKTGEDNTTLLQEATLTYLANSSCTEYKVGGASESQLCMSGDIDVGSGLRNSTCQGDSGGPLYWNGKQVGITSYGPLAGCGLATVTATSVFTEVTDYSGWITNVKNGLVAATYSTSESDREYYRLNGRLPDAVSDVLGSGGGGGGSVPLWSSLVMLAMAIFRKKRS